MGRASSTITAILITAVVACGGTPSASSATQAAATSSTSSTQGAAATTSSGGGASGTFTKKPCDLATAAEVLVVIKAELKSRVTSLVASDSSTGGIPVANIYGCTYNASGGGPSGVFSVIIHDGPVAGPFMAAIRIDKTATKLSGIGDEAYGRPDRSEIDILKGGVHVLLDGRDWGDYTKMVDLAKTVAGRM